MQTDMNMAKDIDIGNRENVLPDNFVADIRSIIEQGRQKAYAAVNLSSIATFWNVGRCIVVEEQNGESRAEYGTRLIKTLAEKLVPLYGNSYCK